MRLLQAHLNSLLLLLLTFMVVSLSALGVSTNHKWVFWLLYDMYHVCDLHCMPTMTQKIEVNTCFDKIKVILRLALSSFILVKVAHTEAARIAPKTWYLSHFFGVFGFWCHLKMTNITQRKPRLPSRPVVLLQRRPDVLPLAQGGGAFFFSKNKRNTTPM